MAGPIDIPTGVQLDAATAAFDKDWGGVDEVLYRICAETPLHTDRRAVTAKLALVGRAYSAGLERCVTPPTGQQAITVVADHLHTKGAEVDAVVAQVMAVEEPLSESAMQGIVAAHGLLLQTLCGVCNTGKTPRSFAAKYLHFHNPAVPIYDDYARIGLSRLVPWDGQDLPFPRPQGSDQIYYSFCVRFWRLYDACLSAGVRASVKSLDQYLWAVPTAGT